MLACPIVRVIDNLAVLVLAELVAVNDPFDCGLAVDDVIVGGERDASYATTSMTVRNSCAWRDAYKTCMNSTDPIRYL